MRKLENKADLPLSSRSNPYYVDVANDLRKEILDSEYSPGDRIFTQRDLVKKYKRSLPTIRSAIEILISENLIEAKARSGYYLTNKVDIMRSNAINKVLVVMPAYTSPIEPFFTGRLISGVLNKAKQSDTAVSFYQRESPRIKARQEPLAELDRILSLEPKGIIWLHAIQKHKSILNELKTKKIPAVLSMRHIEGCDLPVIREDDGVYASMITSYLVGKGHKKLSIIVEDVEDEYYHSKVSAIKLAGKSLGISINDDDIFPKNTKILRSEWDGKFGTYMSSKNNTRAFVILSPILIEQFFSYMNSHHEEKLEEYDIVCNILDGVDLSKTRSTYKFLEITPPLEQLGENLFQALDNLITRRQITAVPQLISELRVNFPTNFKANVH